MGYLADVGFVWNLEVVTTWVDVSKCRIIGSGWIIFHLGYGLNAFYSVKDVVITKV